MPHQALTSSLWRRTTPGLRLFGVDGSCTGACFTSTPRTATTRQFPPPPRSASGIKNARAASCDCPLSPAYLLASHLALGLASAVLDKLGDRDTPQTHGLPRTCVRSLTRRRDCFLDAPLYRPARRQPKGKGIIRASELSKAEGPLLAAGDQGLRGVVHAGGGAGGAIWVRGSAVDMAKFAVGMNSRLDLHAPFAHRSLRPFNFPLLPHSASDSMALPACLPACLPLSLLCFPSVSLLRSTGVSAPKSRTWRSSS